VPKVSVVLTSFNHAPYLRQAIDSVINQTYTDWELLIWDDVSSDNSWDIIQGYSDPRIRAFRNDRNRRYIYAINESITTVATGMYIAIHHSDDAWQPEKLTLQVAYLDANPHKGAVFTHVQLIDEHNSLLLNDWFNVSNQSRAEWLRCLFLNTNKLCHPSAMVRREEYIKAGLYKLVHAQTDDAEMWTRLLFISDIYVIKRKLTLHRIFSTGANVSGDNPKALARKQFEWFEQKKNYLGISLLDLLEIFPEAKQWLSSTKENNQMYLLAMVLINIGNCQGTRLFGLDLLYRLLTVPATARRIAELYNFDYLDFINLSGEQGLFQCADEQSQASIQPENETASDLFLCADEQNQTTSQATHFFSHCKKKIYSVLSKVLGG